MRRNRARHDWSPGAGAAAAATVAASSAAPTRTVSAATTAQAPPSLSRSTTQLSRRTTPRNDARWPLTRTGVPGLGGASRAGDEAAGDAAPTADGTAEVDTTRALCLLRPVGTVEKRRESGSEHCGAVKQAGSPPTGWNSGRGDRRRWRQG